MKLKRILVTARQRLGMSQRDIAALLGCSHPVVNRLEAGRPVSVAHFMAAREAYGLSDDEWVRVSRLYADALPAPEARA